MPDAATTDRERPPSLTLFFIVEPPMYQVYACYLAASLREQFGNQVTLIGYCPAHRISEIDPDVTEILRRLNVELCGFDAVGKFDPEYPHGNKILATLEPRDTDFSGFMDSDILCLRPNQMFNVIKDGHVSLTPAASMRWAEQSIWTEVYRACGMEIPAERISLMRQKGGGFIPYFSSGFFTFPERHRDPNGQSFAQVWMETAQAVDRGANIDKKRPYLDQLTLPLAIQRAGLHWNLLPEEQHFILGGRMRGKPFPKEREIFTVHYRRWKVLKENGLNGPAKSMLEKHAGVKRVNEIGLAKKSG